jgi:hypothetical protein
MKGFAVERGKHPTRNDGPGRFPQPGDLDSADTSLPAFKLNQPTIKHVRITFGDTEYDRIDYAGTWRSGLPSQKATQVFLLRFTLNSAKFPGCVQPSALASVLPALRKHITPECL